MNLGEARNALVARGYDYLTGTSLDLMLNRAKEDFEDYWPWPWLRATLRAVPAPVDIADLKYVRGVWNADGDVMWGLSLEDVLAAGSDDVASGPPRYWYLQDSLAEHVSLIVWPSSSAPVSIAYIRATPPLVNPNDTPSIPARYHSVWIDWAVVQAHKDSNNYTGASALQGDVVTRMNELVTRYETRNRAHSIFMTSYGFSEDE